MSHESFDANLNDRVLVRMSQTGWDVLADRYEKEYMPKEDKDGYVEFVFWEFMQIFGGLMYNGNVNPPFDMDLKIIKRK